MPLTKVTYPMIDGYDLVTTPNTTSPAKIIRETNYSGGTFGYVTSALLTRTITNADNSNFEWTFTSVLDNYSNAGENVSVYAQANKRSQTGGTWAGVFEAKDWSASSASPNGLLCGLEIDVYANGDDVNRSRIGIDLVAGRTNTSDDPCVVTSGIRLDVAGADPNGASFVYGIVLAAKMTTGIAVACNAVWGIKFEGTHDVGIDTTASTFTQAAIRLGVDQRLDFDASGVMKMKTPSSTDNMLKFINTNTEIFGFYLNAGAPYMRIKSNKVVGERITGFAAMTGAQNPGTVFDTATITLNQLAQRVSSIQAALTSHGLIGA
jgi:hypothetical protein